MLRARRAGNAWGFARLLLNQLLLTQQLPVHRPGEVQPPDTHIPTRSLLLQAAPRLLYARSFAQHFDGKPNGLQAGPIVRASVRFAALRTAVNASILEDYSSAKEVALKVSSRGDRGQQQNRVNDCYAQSACCSYTPCSLVFWAPVSSQRHLLPIPPFQPPAPPHTCKHSQELDQYRPVWEFGRTWDPTAYDSGPSLSLMRIRRELGMQKRWREQLEKMKSVLAAGCLQVLLPMCQSSGCLWVLEGHAATVVGGAPWVLQHLLNRWPASHSHPCRALIRWTSSRYAPSCTPSAPPPKMPSS